MKKIISYFKLEREAHLLDSKMYMIKAFFAIATAYIIASNNNLLSKDMISVLFGLMLTLEPVNSTGVKNGWEQVAASIIGASVTGIIVSIFGLNTITIAISVSLTLYACIKINWRMISPVAIFSSIYMTQYIQPGDSLAQQMFSTFTLRMAALCFGVVIAVFYNYIFSVIAYKKMMHKRCALLLSDAVNNMHKVKTGIKGVSEKELLQFKNEFSDVFSNIEWVYSHYCDLKKDMKYKLYPLSIDEEDYNNLENIIFFARRINYYSYHIIDCLLEDEDKSVHKDKKNKLVNEIDSIIELVTVLETNIRNGNSVVDINFDQYENIKSISQNKYFSVEYDIIQIKNSIINLIS